MTTRNTLLALAITAATVPAVAQTAYTDVAPFTDTSVSAGSTWKGTLSRTDVLNALNEARSAGTLPVSHEIADYPASIKFTPAPAMAAAPRTAVLGGAGSASVTLDGYRFVGGEAGYVQTEPGASR
ncbi:MAG: DUF4148 domain-containing protein [Variovorax sp.]